ncbi:putative GIY-YIG superfamily endonuclease [Bradyrhizobium yuanmingense]
MTDGAYLYILQCADGSYYIGTTRTELEIRVAQHNAGTFEGYTKSRRPVTLVFSMVRSHHRRNRMRAQAQEVEPREEGSVHARRLRQAA